MEDALMPQAKPGLEDRLWYRRPAEHFNEALPVGNGRLGAMIFGSNGTEVLPVNDDRFWAGVRAPEPNPAGPAALAEVRRLIALGERKVAERVIEDRLLTGFNQPYLPAADLTVFWPECTGGEFTMELALDTAIVSVRQTGADGQSLTREYFSSAPDQVMAICGLAQGFDLGSHGIALSSKVRHRVIESGKDLILIADAPAEVIWSGVDDRVKPGEGITYADIPPRSCYTVARVLHARFDGTGSALTILVATCTTDRHNDPLGHCQALLDRAEAIGFDALRARHIADHQALYGRVSLSLGDPAGAPRHLPTDDRLARRAAGGTDQGLEALIFNFGRYLMIASSRPGSMPSNLQGIWNDLVQPPWWSNYTLNINLQMNYWPAEVCNLTECHEPLFDFIDELSHHGAETARVHYGMRGWVSHHQTDFLRQTTPVGRIEGYRVDQPVRYAMWPMSGAWLCQHLWEHFNYNGDRAFLRDRAWPLMRGAALFLLDWLVEAPGGRLTTSPSTSPENLWLSPAGQIGGVCTGSAMDLSILRLHFATCLRAAETLGIADDAILPRLAHALQRLQPLQIGQQGQIMEWDLDWEEGEYPHRHVSQLFDVFPGSAISPEKTPALAAAARKTLDLRGDTGTGWSFAWKIAIWARLGDAARAYRQIDHLLNPVPASVTQCGDDGGGIYPNLFTACPPLMIEANFGYTAGVAELLLQSQDGEIVLLPALPGNWSEGRFSGLRARGGIEIGLTWADGQPRHVSLVSQTTQYCRVRFGNDVQFLRLPGGEPVSFDWRNRKGGPSRSASAA